VRNDLNISISVQLVYEHEELANSYQKPQIIPASKQAGFEVSFSSRQQQLFESSIKYVINGKYEFFFQVKAQVEPVRLDLQTDTVRLAFSDDSHDLFTTENLRIHNNGNSVASFYWICPESGTFTVLPEREVVNPGQYLDCVIMYTPQGNSSGKLEEDKLIIQIGSCLI